MDTDTKDSSLVQIPARIRELRTDMDISAIDMARETGVPVETYSRYESGDLDIPISVLYKIAAQLGVDATVLLTGEDPRMDTAAVCRAGKGVEIERYPGYEFQALAYNFKSRTMEPLLVYLDPAKPPPPPVAHYGQEFNYVIEGRMKVTVAKREYLLEPGDSIYFNATIPHIECADGVPTRFLTIIQEKK